MENPRFPHTLTIKRPTRDSGGAIVLDSDGKPTYDAVTLKIVEMMDGDPVKDADGAFVTEDATSVSFGYRTNSMNIRQAGEVVVADFKIACPMFLAELNFGDELELTDYDRTYRGKLVKKVTYNWGTNIWFDEIRN